MLIVIILSQAISVLGGIVTDANGNEIKIESGTFIPSPADKDLAKKIVEYEFEIKKKNVMIESMKSQMKAILDASSEKEGEYRDEIRRCKIELESRDNWWNEWGKIVLPSIAVGALGGWAGYEIGKR
jgi:hypothetical protein